MADQPTPLNAARGSYLCTVSYFRRADGSIAAALDAVPVHVIEAEPTISARFFKAAQWSLAGMLDLMRQGVRFDDETRAANDAPDG